MKRRIRLLIPVLLAVLVVSLSAQDIASFEKRITVKKLPNGLTVLLMQRKESPTFSFFTMVDAGSTQDPKSQTGLAHMMEHMAFKGTDIIGTNNWPAEKVALQRVEKAYADYNYERHRGAGRDPRKLAQLEKEWKDAIAAAQKYVIVNQFGEIIEANGGEGLNAFTDYDETAYHYSMPVNRLQLWAYLESSRFMHPVMREFYKERDVVIEERRMRTDSQPTGRLLEQFLATSFVAHPYHRPTVGWPSDLNNFSATDAYRFFQRFYVPSNMVIAVVGDLTPATAMPTIEKYFDQLPSQPKPLESPTIEPPQNAERRVTLTEQAQPIYVEGYHRPDFRDPDDAVYDAITDLMSNGRTSRLYRALVRDKKIAAVAAGFSGLPGTKYPHLFAFFAVPLPGHTPDEMRDAIHVEIEKIRTQPITDDELKMIKTRAKAALIRSLGDNEGLAQELAVMQMRYGDWRELFRQVDRIDKVTKEDIMRVSKKIFVPGNRTVGVIETAKPAGPPPEKQPPAQVNPGGAQ